MKKDKFKKKYIKKSQLESWKEKYILDNGNIWAGTPEFIEVNVYHNEDILKHNLKKELELVKQEIKIKDIKNFEKLEKLIYDLTN